jgi:ribosomal protein S27AE
MLVFVYERMRKEGNSMFCPKCGNPLLLKHSANGRDELYCGKGDMGLSQVMRQKFEERYGHPGVPQSPNPPFDKQFHGGFHWFCPGDGEQLNAQLECSTCGKHLRDLVYPLVEFHPHA